MLNFGSMYLTCQTNLILTVKIERQTGWNSRSLVNCHATSYTNFNTTVLSRGVQFVIRFSNRCFHRPFALQLYDESSTVFV